MVHHKKCPTCGSTKIRRVRKTIARSCCGKTYTVPAVVYHECPACGEEIFSPEAVRKIQASSPAFAASRRA